MVTVSVNDIPVSGPLEIDTALTVLWTGIHYVIVVEPNILKPKSQTLSS